MPVRALVVALVAVGLWLASQSARASSFGEGVQAFERGDPAAAAAIWEPLAAAGNASAAFNLAVLYEQGMGVEQDFKKAAHWYARAARAGDPQARMAMGKLHEAGKGVPQSVADARLWYAMLLKNPPASPQEQALQQEARARLASLPLPARLEVPFEGGRYLFVEAARSRCVIALQGQINRETTRTFPKVVEHAKAQGCQSPLIVLESGGGLVSEGLSLGREMHLEGYSTVVRGSCASACGLIFMGGRERIMVGRSARIGFHQASTRDSSVPDAPKDCRTDRFAGVNIRIRDYLRFVLGPEVAADVMEKSLGTSCRSMEWVYGPEALSLKVATRVE